jgi:Zn-dependent protease with chaperone function
VNGPVGFRARFFDGRTARARDAIAELTAGSVRVRAPDGFALADWPADTVRLVRRHRAGQPLQLRSDADDLARLAIDDPAAYAALTGHCANLHRVGGDRRGSWKPIVAWSAGALASLAFVLTVGLPWLARAVVEVVPIEREVAWGRDIAGHVAQAVSRRLGGGAARFCETAAGRAALDRLVARLAGGVDLATPLTVRVLDVPVANAFALPGGQILLLSGLVAEARDPGEVAGVLAHEIGHVAHRHPLELVIEQIGAATLLSYLIGDVSGGTIIVAGTQLLLISSYSRDAERAADAMTVEILNAAGIAAGPVAALFERLADEQARTEEALAMFSSHPLSRERAQAIRRASTGSGAAMSEDDWRALRAICDE